MTRPSEHWLALRRPAADEAEALPAGVDRLLAWHALRFTPRVAWVEDAAPNPATASPSTPAPTRRRAQARSGDAAARTLVLEIAASERLFGGRAALIRRFFEEIPPIPGMKWAQGATVWIAVGRLDMPPIAPVDEAGSAPAIECGARVAPEALPLAALAAARPHLDTLARLGCRSWGELRALPRAALARRLGPALLEALDQAWGLRPTVLPWLVLPERFDEAVELPFALESAPALLAHAQGLLAQLRAWLCARTQGVLALELIWQHDRRRDGPVQGRLPLRTAEPTADLEHIERLLAEHLARVVWPAPVQRVRLRVRRTAPLSTASESLLPLAAGERADALAWHALTERLSARLGAGAVLRVQREADPRPEAMQRWVPADASKNRAIKVQFSLAYPGKTAKNGTPECGSAMPAALLPSWLLERPLRLALRGERPLYQGALELRVGPQRIEALRWDAAAAAPDPQALVAQRDYFIAESPGAGLVWVFRERRRHRAHTDADAGEQAQWFLHGFFG
ncbi:DNA polymerase Y family protein [Tibeticola sp.]|uniref:DNA polymerase Y family protein n=1 Tax=Tibeticola sp. TaxID=2005368 RepID=UPI002582A852|nr:DNA polymerase Y family protein [Tibeticola sp.]MCI4439716.1 DNA polymerase Y family protein [Tibeticola sp.]